MDTAHTYINTDDTKNIKCKSYMSDPLWSRAVPPPGSKIKLCPHLTLTFQP